MVNDITGVVLAGGRSSRFGRDKGLFTYHGKPMVERAIDILSGQFHKICISTNDIASYSYLDLPLIPDVFPGCGPLGGIYSCLQSLLDKDNSRGIAVLSCDMPNVPGGLFSMLMQNLKEYSAVVPAHGRFKETTCAIFTLDCLPAFEKAIKEKRYKILDALACMQTNYMDVGHSSLYHQDMFHNINYPADAKFGSI